MRRVVVAVFLAVVVLGCESDHRIQVENASSTQLRVMLSVPGGGVSTVTPAPGSSASVVVTEDGPFSAVAVLDSEWLEAARFRREFLSRQLSDPAVRRGLTPDDLQQISAQVNDLSLEIRRATEQPSQNVGGCSGRVELGSPGGEAGRVRITDNPAGGFPSVCAAVLGARATGRAAASPRRRPHRR